jgi:hypothetical protein
MKTLTVFLAVLMAGVCHAGLIVTVGQGSGGLTVDLTDKFDSQEFLHPGPPEGLPPGLLQAKPFPNTHRYHRGLRGHRDFKGQRGKRDFKGQRGLRDHKGIVASVTGPSSQGTHAAEPATMILLGSGIIGIAVLGRKKIRKN